MLHRAARAGRALAPPAEALEVVVVLGSLGEQELEEFGQPLTPVLVERREQVEQALAAAGEQALLRPPPVALLAVAVGFGGVAILVLPDDGTQAAPLGWMLVLVGAALVEAIGQFGAQRVALPDPWTNTAIQLLGSGVVLVVLGVAIGELGDVRTDALTWASAGAFAYLLLPGSLLAYGAFVWLLDHARIATVATYAYVNPVVAVAAGWALLGEQVSATMAAAAALILGAVVLVVRERG